MSRIALTLSAAGLAACAAQPPNHFVAADACSVSAPGYDSREVQCRFGKAQFARTFRFKANFSGGHDDTMARIEPLLNDVPLECAAGSKISLFAEDGEVSLWCTFSVAAPAQGDSTFKVTVRFSHAEYVDYEIAAQ